MLGSGQQDAMQDARGELGFQSAGFTTYQRGGFGALESGDGTSIRAEVQAGVSPPSKVEFRLGKVARTSTETRSSNTAFTPRLHA